MPTIQGEQVRWFAQAQCVCVPGVLRRVEREAWCAEERDTTYESPMMPMCSLPADGVPPVLPPRQVCATGVQAIICKSHELACDIWRETYAGSNAGVVPRRRTTCSRPARQRHRQDLMCARGDSMMPHMTSVSRMRARGFVAERGLANHIDTVRHR